jgi:hypothetical protein
MLENMLVALGSGAKLEPKEQLVEFPNLLTLQIVDSKLVGLTSDLGMRFIDSFPINLLENFRVFEDHESYLEFGTEYYVSGFRFKNSCRFKSRDKMNIRSRLSHRLKLKAELMV